MNALMAATLSAVRCESVNTVSLHASWPPTSGADLYELQLSLDGSFKPFLSTTSLVSSVVVSDLLPSTTYQVAFRARDGASRNWTLHGSSATRCTTASLAPHQLHVLPPTEKPEAHQVTLRMAPSLPAGSIAVEYRQLGVDVPWSMTRLAGPPFKLTGLSAGTSYEVRAAQVLADGFSTGELSDAVVLRTASTAWAALQVFRISENCGEMCDVDFLYDHDAGDLLSDVDFITHVANSSSFVRDFNTSVLTRYCVEHATSAPTTRAADVRPYDASGADHADFADYVSCNGADTEHYVCECNNWIDRCIGRLDMATCTNTSMACGCTAESLADSARRVGRMPVFAPFPTVDFKRYDCNVPPRATSTFLGYWYSFPSKAECTTESRPPQSTPPQVEATECSWRRQPTQHFVRGYALLELGFNTSHVCDVPELLQNRDVIETAFAQHPTRCCGC